MPITAKLVANIITRAGSGPSADDGSARRPDPGFLRRAGRPSVRRPGPEWLFPRHGTCSRTRSSWSARTRGASSGRSGIRSDSAAAWPLSTNVDAMRPETRQENIIGGPIEGKVALMFDDMISTAGSICGAARTGARGRGREIYVAATHGVLSGEAVLQATRRADHRVVLTDTIPLTPSKMTRQDRDSQRCPTVGRSHQADPPRRVDQRDLSRRTHGLNARCEHRDRISRRHPRRTFSCHHGERRPRHPRRARRTADCPARSRPGMAFLGWNRILSYCRSGTSSSLLDLGRDGDDATGNRGDFGRSGKRDAPLGLPLRLVLPHHDPGTDRFDVLKDLFIRARHPVLFSGKKPWGVSVQKNSPLPPRRQVSRKDAPGSVFFDQDSPDFGGQPTGPQSSGHARLPEKLRRFARKNASPHTASGVANGPQFVKMVDSSVPLEVAGR